ncbi:GNAT family N-acetyltransferase [Caulobacter sp. SLTY]|uniref:GNAT family N-acetyltransferase n=1 Tax=Caulobacter sp. SLTY TaxID=2683262 RepID=UPI00141232D4|nr:GNAT family N-acetyltransferase [Caulobacter sp. SLTY]
MTELVTARLLLRPVTPADEEDLYSLERDPEVMRYLNGGRPTPRHPPPVDDQPFRMPRGTEDDVWAAFADERFIGWFSLWVGDDRVGWLGYRLHRHAWGQGFGHEGAAALVDHGFRAQGLTAIHATTMAINLGSRRIMAKLGMRHLRTYDEPHDDPIPGAEEGEVEYGVSAAEWLGQH